jgi:hypothetical protein
VAAIWHHAVVAEWAHGQLEVDFAGPIKWTGSGSDDLMRDVERAISEADAVAALVDRGWELVRFLESEQSTTYWFRKPLTDS